MVVPSVDLRWHWNRYASAVLTKAALLMPPLHIFSRGECTLVILYGNHKTTPAPLPIFWSQTRKQVRYDESYGVTYHQCQIGVLSQLPDL